MNLNVTRVLLADDDRDDRELFAEALAELDPAIVYHGVEDGKQALKLLSTPEASQPNIIFVDVNMPVMNGWDLLKSLKNDAQLENIPVIVYSTSSRLTDRTIAQNLGAMCFLTKPDSFKLVKNMLEVVLTHLRDNRISEMCSQIHKKLKL